MAEKGGVMGVVALGYLVGPDPGGQTTVETYIDHIDHVVNIAGIDHVGLASDFVIQGISSSATRGSWYEPRLESFKPSYQVQWPPRIPELDSNLPSPAPKRTREAHLTSTFLLLILPCAQAHSGGP